MNPRTLKALMKARGISQSELARRLKISRQAVSLWLKQPDQAETGIRDRHLMRLAQAFDLPAEHLTEPLLCFEPGNHSRLMAIYLWDRLFEDLDDFAIAVNARDPRAVARLVQVGGLYAAEKMLGDWVWDALDDYGRHMHPVRRQQLETLARWHSNRKVA